MGKLNSLLITMYELINERLSVDSACVIKEGRGRVYVCMWVWVCVYVGMVMFIYMWVCVGVYMGVWKGVKC